MKRIGPFLWWCIGEILIISGFLHFGQNVNQSFLILDIIISSIIFNLIFIDVLFPPINLKDKSGKKVGSIGIRWFVGIIYSITAIGAMLFFGLSAHLDLTSQIIIHGILLFLMLTGMWGAYIASKKVEAVYHEQTENRQQIDEIKRSIGEAKSKFESRKDIPEPVMTGLKKLQDDIRFITPANEGEAFELEIRILSEIKLIIRKLDEEPVDFEIILDILQNCSRLFIERKQVYSN